MQSARVRMVVSVGCVLAMLVGCDRRMSAIEQKVVGTWDRTGMDHTQRYVFGADRRLQTAFAEGDSWMPFSSGTWRVEGSDIVMDETYAVPPEDGGTPVTTREVSRMPVVEFQQEKLVREKGRPPLVRVK